MPEALIDKLANGGIMMVPVGKEPYQKLYIITKDMNGNVMKVPKLSVTFIPLTEAKKQWAYN